VEKYRIHIGTSGWHYKHWLGTFYPEEVKASGQFDYYKTHFNTVEINNSFYRLPAPETFAGWRENTPEGFVFAVKASRYITHMKKLRDPKQSLAAFLENSAYLEKKLGVILFQLPPFLKNNTAILQEFLQSLPKGERYVFEFRNESWYTPEIYTLLKKYNCAFCIYELDGFQTPLEVTADFVYVRLHGPGRKYQGSYDRAALKLWAARCREWQKSGDVFLYFDNDEKGYAAFNAESLITLTAG
jgi:uncharacterized protein YecE (DUF72 family)